MPWKRGENNSLVIGEGGHPIFVYPDGNEVEFEPDSQVVKIRELTEKANKRKVALEAASKPLTILTEAGIDTSDEDSIKDFVKTARKNADTVKNFDDSQYVKADEVQKIKDAEAQRYSDQIKTSEANFKKAIGEKEEVISNKSKLLHKSLVRNAFATSPFIREKTAYPTPDIAYQDNKHFFEVDESDGEATAYGVKKDGTKIYSLKNPTDVAGPHEAIEIIINSRSDKDSLLLAEGTGTGSEQGGKKKTVSNAAIIQRNDKQAFSSNIEKIASGEVQVSNQ